MTVDCWKEQFLNKVGIKNVSIFIVARKDKWPLIKNNIKSIPFPCRFYDPTLATTYDFIYKMMELNEKAYGKGMAAPLWTYSNFGTIGAGINGGFQIGEVPISKFNVVGDAVDPDISHEWTLLTDPEYQGKSIGTATLALALQVCSHKKYHTFITQTDNPSNLIYLKNSCPLEVQAYGFVHTKPNSMLLKTKIPSHPFMVIVNGGNGKSDTDIISVENSIPVKVDSLDHMQFLDINMQIQKGKLYNFIKWEKEANGQINLYFICY